MNRADRRRVPDVHAESDRDPPDLRLTGFALGTWLTAYSGLYLPLAVTIGAVGLAGLLGTGVLVYARSPARHRGTWATIATAVLLGVCLGGSVTAARVAERDADPLRRLAHERATVRAELVVTDDPRPLRTVAGRPTTYLVPARLRRLSSGLEVRLTARVLVLASNPGWRSLLPGQKVVVSGRLSPARGGDLRAAALSTVEEPVRIGRPPWVQRLAAHPRAGLQRACEPLPDEPGGLLPGLVVGDTSRLGDTLAADFRATGLSHLTAVSGANCAVVTGTVLLLAGVARLGQRPAAVSAMVALAAFVVLARPSPSVLRAAGMGAVTIIGLASGRPRAALPALGTTVAALVVIDPELAAAPGFALSVLATAGLLLLAPAWRDALRRRRIPAGMAEALSVPLAAQAACAPLIAGLSGTVSLVAVPANILAAPVVAPATVLGVVAALLSPCWPVGAQVLAWLAAWPARWLVAIAHHGADVPWAALDWPAGAGGALLLAGLLGVALVAARRRTIRRLVVVVAVAAVLAAVPLRLVVGRWPPPHWLVVACAVGQGDAVVFPAGGGAAVVVDVGPEPDAVDGCLRQLGIGRVPLLFVTHFHADHTAGIAGVLRRRAVGAILTTGFPEPVEGRSAVHAAAGARGVPVRSVRAGWYAEVGGLRITALVQPRTLRDTRSDPNNNSLVLRVSIGGRAVLLTGDAEGEEQSTLLAEYGRGALRADVIKLAHHGSGYQNADFLNAVGAAAALVSVGAGNRYGHPSEALLARLRRSSTRVMRTDLDGDVAVVVTGGGGLAVAANAAGRGEPDR